MPGGIGGRIDIRAAYADPARPHAERIEDLLERLTLDEKVGLLHQHQPAIPRLDLPAFTTGTEVLHGVAWLGQATVFPQPIGLASAWDPDLLRRVGAAVGDEARAILQRPGTPGGLNVWAPVVDLLRDPRAGRNEEAYSEDPLLTGACSTAYARGLRGEHPTYLKTAPTLKHFLAYNNEADRDTTSASIRPRLLREYYLNAFLPALRDGAAVAVMPSYNLVNGRPAHVSPYIEELRACAPDEVLVVSDAHAPTNLVTSQHYFASHAHAHAAALRAGLDSFTDRDGDASFTTGALHEALDAGLLTETDVDRALRHVIAIRLRLGDLDPPERNPWRAIDGTVVNCDEHRALAREAVRRSLVLLRNDGLLPLPAATSSVAVVGPLCDEVREDWYSGTMPYAVTPAGGIRDLGRAAVGTEEGHDHVALRARDSGRYVTAFAGSDGAHLRIAGAPSRGPGLHQQFDLLDWGEDVFSLRSRSDGMCVSLHPLGGDATDPPLVADQREPNGWTVHETFAFVDDRDGTVVLRNVATGRWWRTAVDGTLVATRHRAAATRFDVERLSDGAARAAGVAARADAAIVVLGNHPMVNGRETQDRTVITLPPAQERLLRAVVAANPRTVLVVETGYPVAIGWADANVPAIVWTSHGGQEVGAGLADVLFGAVAPAGRLTQTWYASLAGMTGIDDYDIITSRRTYLYFDGVPLYPFGHGLSYTTFEYGPLRVTPGTTGSDGTVTLQVAVTNSGAVAGDEVVQVYSRSQAPGVDLPRRQLRAFERVHLAPGETATVRFDIAVADLSFWDVVEGRFAVPPGRHDLLVGSSSEDIRQVAAVTVDAPPLPLRAATRTLRAVDFDDHHGVEIVDEHPAHGDAVATAAAGGWIALHRVDFGDGVAEMSATVARDTDGEVALQVRLDEPEGGRLVGTAAIACSAGRYRWVTTSCDVATVTGVHDVYIVLGGAARLLDVRFGGGPTVTGETVERHRVQPRREHRSHASHDHVERRGPAS